MKLFTLTCLAFVAAAVAVQIPKIQRRDYGDCRDTSCPGGSCVSSNATDPGAAYICHFDPATPTSKVIDDCRKPGGACPGGFCVSSNTTDPDAGFYCSFTVTPEQSTQLAQIAASSAAAGGSNDKAPTTLANIAATTSKAGSNAAALAGVGSSASATVSNTVASISAAVHTGGASKIVAGQGLLWVVLGAIALA